MLKNWPLLVALSLAGTASLFAVEVGVGVGVGGGGVGVNAGVHTGGHRDGYRYHGGSVVQFRGGVEVPVTSEVTLTNGARILPDGYIVYRDGRRERFVEDRWIGTDGEWVAVDATPVDNFEGYYWEDDHLYVIRAGVPTIVTTEVVLDNGTRLLPSGEYITREGVRNRFTAGVEIDLHGRIATGDHHRHSNRTATDVSARNTANTRQPNANANANTNTAPNANTNTNANLNNNPNTTPNANTNTNLNNNTTNPNPAVRNEAIRDTREANRDVNQANREATRENREATRDVNQANREANRDVNQANREATRDTREATRENREATRENHETPRTPAPSSNPNTEPKR